MYCLLRKAFGPHSSNVHVVPLRSKDGTSLLQDQVGITQRRHKLACWADENNLVYLVCTSANRFFYGIKLRWTGFSWQNLIGTADTFVQSARRDWSNSGLYRELKEAEITECNGAGIVGKQL